MEQKLKIKSSIAHGLVKAAESHMRSRGGTKENKASKPEKKQPLKATVHKAKIIDGEPHWGLQEKLTRFNENGEPFGRIFRKDFKAERWTKSNGWKVAPTHVRKGFEELIEVDENGIKLNLADGTYDFALNSANKLFVNVGESFWGHPSLIGGKNPVVKSAGEMMIKGGKVIEISNKSGHFFPDARSNDVLKLFFDEFSSRQYPNHGDDRRFKIYHHQIKLTPVIARGSAK